MNTDRLIAALPGSDEQPIATVTVWHRTGGVGYANMRELTDWLHDLQGQGRIELIPCGDPAEVTYVEKWRRRS